MIKIYGSPLTSSGRCFWMLEEAGVAYEQDPLSMREGQHKSPEYLAINPNGKVPTLVDNGLVIWESMAITQYLADKYKPELIPDTPEQRSQVNQWSYWSIVDLQPPLIDILIQTQFVPEKRRNLALLEKAQTIIPSRLQMLDDQLKKVPFVTGDDFTIADLNVASVVGICQMVKIDLKPYAGITLWLEKISQRPGFQKFLELQKAAQGQ